MTKNEKREEMVTGLPSAQGKIELENRGMKRIQAEWSNPPFGGQHRSQPKKCKE